MHLLVERRMKSKSKPGQEAAHFMTRIAVCRYLIWVDILSTALCRHS